MQARQRAGPGEVPSRRRRGVSHPAARRGVRASRVYTERRTHVESVENAVEGELHVRRLREREEHFFVLRLRRQRDRSQRRGLQARVRVQDRGEPRADALRVEHVVAMRGSRARRGVRHRGRVERGRDVRDVQRHRVSVHAESGNKPGVAEDGKQPRRDGSVRERPKFREHKHVEVSRGHDRDERGLEEFHGRGVRHPGGATGAGEFDDRPLGSNFHESERFHNRGDEVYASTPLRRGRGVPIEFTRRGRRAGRGPPAVSAPPRRIQSVGSGSPSCRGF